jgi:hypothetical protein
MHGGCEYLPEAKKIFDLLLSGLVGDTLNVNGGRHDGDWLVQSVS